ncbi:MAG: hypothetical protein BWZ02_00759 [Lentisphaerae bacterium ADurb.BinA184]|nr:MAG: hypothetical protein BWZ02_00759 [Lentisphaerae bacterium ADurb.BinA184]
MAGRLLETKRIFGQPVYAVDIHTHSTFSDGRGTVEQNYQAARNAGLDFLFATDHGSLAQKRKVKRWPDASWGQEPGVGGHHLGLLEGRKLFRPPKTDLAAICRAAQQIAPFIWIPHPVGWYNQTWYDDQRIAELWTLGDCFAIEVMNGAGKIVRAYDAFDQKAVAVWDRLLSDGRKVTALGGSDAHTPDQIGTVWTGVFAKRRTSASIIRALNQGRCFASEASLLDFRCGTDAMGSTIGRRKGCVIKLQYRVADATGIASARIVANGATVEEIDGRNQPLVTGSLTHTVGSRPTYFRIESMASDSLRAFSSPIYICPA